MMHPSLLLMDVNSMQIDHLNYLIEVAKVGSISAAANNLHTSQSNISQAVHKIEKELGVTIFNRSAKGTTPTSAGQNIVEKAHEIIYHFEELKSIANINSSSYKGELTIAAIPAFSMYLLPKTISILKSKYPGLKINVIEETSSEIMEYITSKRIDIGLTGIPDKKFIENENVKSTYFIDSEILACVSKNSPLANKKYVNLDELINYPIISTSDQVINKLKQHGNPKFLFKSKTMEGSKVAITHGLAVGFYTDISLKFDPYVRTGEIIPIRISEKGFNLPLYFVQQKNRFSISVKYFLEEFKKQVEIFNHH